MLRPILVTSFLVSLLLLGAPPVAAEGETRACAGQALDGAGPASLESWVQAAAAGQPASHSGPSAQSECTAEVTCQSGARVQCTGSSCREYPGCWVQCDGQTVQCPPPPDGGLPCPHPL